MTIDNGGETVNCQLSTVNLIHVDFDDDFDDSYYEQAAEQIYDNGGYNPEMLSTQKGSALINETFRVFNTAIDKGLGEEPDPKVSAALRENAFIFSGFKTHAELEQVSQMLTDEKGNIKPFNEFLNDIQSINQDYNHNYLRTEYNQALQAAQMAGKWADFEKNKDFINLQYRTANDERVRASHRILHGTTLPVDDPFWKQYTPPNGWGCRCTVVAVLKDDYPVQDSHGSIAKAESCFKTPKEKMFKENLAEKKRLFPSKHPYLPKSCNSCPLNNGKQLAVKGSKGDCGKDCKVFKDFKEKIENTNSVTDKNRIAKERTTKAAEGVGIWRKSKGNPRLRINNKADQTEIKENTRCALSVLKSFPEMELGIRPHIISKDGIKNPEFISGDYLGDRKGITGFNSVKDEIKKALKQGCQFVIIDLDEHHLTPKINDLKNDIKNKIADFESGILKAVYIVFNDNAVVITKDQFIKGKEIAGEKIRKILNRLL